MKKAQIQKKELKLNDFNKLKIDASQQKKITGGEGESTDGLIGTIDIIL